MARYDYSLDVGKSIETDEKIKELEKEQPEGCCSAPKPPEKSPGDEEQPVEEEQLENVPEEKAEENPEPQKPASSDSKVEIKPISFEKAKLISDFEQKPEEKKEEPEEKEPEEDEQDINEFLEESFSRESKEHEEIQNKKNNNKEIIIEQESNRKKWIITIAIILIAIIASAFGYIYFKEPAQPTGAVVTPEMINLTQILQENTTNETVVEPTAEEIPAENKSTEDILEDFTSALKD
ncbi:hypothetical protein KY338_03395 [Candidatus Woesearchaeota archaeon]|nr:hypothetical protein [Candidatus Woesearchaeota archaeon]MBW3005352.1 hypothetical protein [Candidatus Woesearchaeota archaeon]